jgi:hypothetical protein
MTILGSKIIFRLLLGVLPGMTVPQANTGLYKFFHLLSVLLYQNEWIQNIFVHQKSTHPEKPVYSIFSYSILHVKEGSSTFTVPVYRTCNTISHYVAVQFYTVEMLFCNEVLYILNTFYKYILYVKYYSAFL